MLGQQQSTGKGWRSLVTQLFAFAQHALSGANQAFKRAFEMAGCVDPFVRFNAESFKDGWQGVIYSTAFIKAQLPAGPVQQFQVVLKPEWQTWWHVLSGVPNKG